MNSDFYCKKRHIKNDKLKDSNDIKGAKRAFSLCTKKGLKNLRLIFIK